MSAIKAELIALRATGNSSGATFPSTLDTNNSPSMFDFVALEVKFDSQTRKVQGDLKNVTDSVTLLQNDYNRLSGSQINQTQNVGIGQVGI